MRVTLRWMCGLVAFALAGCATPPTGRYEAVSSAPSQHGQAAERAVTVWLPPGYDQTDARYPVIYAHDGQNLFEPGNAFGGQEWMLDETLEQMIAAGEIPPVIVVALSNTARRWQDYAPQNVIERLPAPLRAQMLEERGAPLYGDAYVAYLVGEVKPQIDRDYRTRPAAEHTFLLGSSMGGLISLYALGQHPEVFGGAAMLSIHWPLADPNHPDALEAIAAMQSWLEQSGLDPDRQRLWFDRGTEGLDSHYAPYALAMEAYFDHRGWPAAFRTYEGTDHNEAAWAARLDEPLRHLLGSLQP